MELPVNLDLDGTVRQYLVSFLSSGTYLATLQDPQVETSALFPREILLQKTDNKWKYDHVLGIIIGEAIDEYNKPKGRL